MLRKPRSAFPGSTRETGVVFGVPQKNRSKIHPVGGGADLHTRGAYAPQQLNLRGSEALRAEYLRSGGGCLHSFSCFLCFFVVEYRIPTSNQREPDSISQR